jgi:membrane-bound serine protease (ClpP class)
MNIQSVTGMLTALFLVCSVSASPAARAEAWLIDVEGAIGPATADHMVRGLAQAQQAAAELVILRIDTPGGLDTSMREMIKAVLGAGLPVVGYVHPSGARAASAGTYLLYATHVAAMSPGTNLGAATPVQIGSPGMPQLPQPEGGEGGEDDGGQKQEPGPPVPGTPMERKIVNDAVAYIQSLAQLRGRNAEWAEKAVREGASLSAEDALAQQVIDIVADSVEDLLAQLDGREVAVGEGVQTLQTEQMAVHRHPMDWRSEFLAVITDPNIAYVLMLVGIYGLIIEFYNPGIGVPGVVGGVCLLLALYAFQVLPISYAGLGLILLGIALMTAEAFAPSFGILGLGGIVAFIVGSIMLMDTALPGYQIAVPMIVAFAAFSAALLMVALGLILRARRQAVVTGPQHLVGQRGEVEVLRGEHVYVRLDGELWQADSELPLALHDTVTVDAIDGLVLKVSKDGKGGGGF